MKGASDLLHTMVPCTCQADDDVVNEHSLMSCYNAGPLLRMVDSTRKRQVYCAVSLTFWMFFQTDVQCRDADFGMPFRSAWIPDFNTCSSSSFHFGRVHLRVLFYMWYGLSWFTLDHLYGSPKWVQWAAAQFSIPEISTSGRVHPSSWVLYTRSLNFYSSSDLAI